MVHDRLTVRSITGRISCGELRISHRIETVAKNPIFEPYIYCLYQKTAVFDPLLTRVRSTDRGITFASIFVVSAGISSY